MSWAFMIAAVLSEVTATLTLKSAATGRPRLYLGVPLGYVLAFAFLTGALRAGMPLGVAYGVWTAAGVALTAIFSRVIHKEPMTPLMIAGTCDDRGRGAADRARCGALRPAISSARAAERANGRSARRWW